MVTDVVITHRSGPATTKRGTPASVHSTPTTRIRCLVLAASVSAQTALDYFNELEAANAFNHYKDEYVCFRDDDVPTFMVVAKGSDVIEMKKKAGDLAGSRRLADSKDLLFLQSYYKGVASEEFIYEPVKKDVTDDNREYGIEFKSPFLSKMVYTINWVTGRYLQRVYMYQKSRTIPSKEGSGRCELIHPKQQ